MTHTKDEPKLTAEVLSAMFERWAEQATEVRPILIIIPPGLQEEFEAYHGSR